MKYLIADLPTASFASRTGKRWLYSDLGHTILQLALERAAKEPYVNMVKERILYPLCMIELNSKYFPYLTTIQPVVNAI